MNSQLYPLQIWVSRLDKRLYAILVGVVMGLIGAGVGLLLAVGGPIIALAAIAGVTLGFYVLTDLRIALYGIIGIMSKSITQSVFRQFSRTDSNA